MSPGGFLDRTGIWTEAESQIKQMRTSLENKLDVLVKEQKETNRLLRKISSAISNK